MSVFLRTLLSSICLASLLLVSSGCGSGKGKAVEGVTGKVTLGETAVAGQVVFIAADGNQYPAPIAPDGTYSASSLPKGDMKIIVKSEVPVTPMLPKGAEAPQQLQKGGATAPAKYSKPDNGLKLTVTGGLQTHNIVLEP